MPPPLRLAFIGAEPRKPAGRPAHPFTRPWRYFRLLQSPPRAARAFLYRSTVPTPGGAYGCCWDNEVMVSEVVRCGHCGQANRVPGAAAGTPRCAKCHEPLPWIAEADDTTFSEVAEAAKVPVLVDLWAPWCGPCRMISPALEQVARDLAGQIKLVKVNVDISPAISRRFEAQAIPTLLILRRGQVKARQTGAVPLASLRTWVSSALASTAN